MKTKRGCGIGAAVLAASGALIVLVVVAGVLIYRRQRGAALAMAPTVYVTDPVSGSGYRAGTSLTVAATAVGAVPVVRLELWADGQRVDEQVSPNAEGESTLYATLAMSVGEGSHSLFVRAVNASGVIGQSMPITYHGVPEAETGPSLLVIRAGEGQSLDDIAAQRGVDVEAVGKLNPNLSSGPLPAGTQVLVPAPTDDDDPEPVPPPAAVEGIPAEGQALQPAGPAPILLRLTDMLVATPPAAPEGLSATLEGCKLTLNWGDRSANESRFDVWSAAPGGSPYILASVEASPGIGQVSFVLDPAPGGTASFWVEAVNGLGSQPSNIVQAAVDAACSTVSASHLELEALDFSVQGRFDQAYCYVSIDGLPEMRIPADESQFIALQGETGDIAAWASANRKLVVPRPADGSLSLGGECWGWTGESLSKVGAFDTAVAQAAWDGSRQSIAGGLLSLGIAVRPFDSAPPPPPPPGAAWDQPGAPGVIPGGGAWNDPSMPVPYNVKDEAHQGWLFVPDPRDRTVTWKWDGNPADITGFTIQAEVQPGWVIGVQVKDPKARSATLTLPAACGLHVRYRVIAGAGGHASNPSAPHEYDQPPCAVFASVTFESIDLKWTNEGMGGPSCDELNVYIIHGVNNVTRHHWGGCSFNVGCQLMPMQCGVYNFSEIIPFAKEATIVVQLPTTDLKLFMWTHFWDYDPYGGNDIFGHHGETLTYATYAEAKQDIGCGKSILSGPKQTDTAKSEFLFTVKIYPNDCGEALPYQP
jgi:hypothetical protein